MRKSCRCSQVAMLLALLFLLGWQMSAQFSSSVQGTVTDPSGAPIPEATVTLTNVALGVTQTTQSSASGNFRFPSLPPGTYKLSVNKQGFETTIQGNVALDASEVKTVNLAMKVGQVQSEITVTAGVVAVQQAEAKISGDITGQEVRALPLPGRNILDMVQQAPGVTGVGNASQNAADNDIFTLVGNPMVNANGNRGSSNGFYVDNASVNSNPDPGVYNIVPNPESIQEFHVAVNDYSAEYGRTAGMVIQAVTKSGTNQFHGSLFENHQDNKLTSRNVFENQPDPLSGRLIPVFRRNEFGGSIGGPFQKNKMFGFMSWDQLRSSQPGSGIVTIEAPDFVNFLKTNLPNNLSTQLLTSYPTAVQNASLSNVQTVASQMQSNLGLTCAGTGPLGMPCNLPLFGSTVYTSSPARNGLQYNTRVDRYFHDSKDRVYANYFQKNSHTDDTNIRPGFRATVDPFDYLANLNWTHTFSASVINEAGVSFDRVGGGGACLHCEVPQMGPAQLPGFGDGFSPALFVQNDYHWRDVLQINRGKHNVKAGLDIFRDQENDLFSGSQQRPFYSFQDVFDFANDGNVITKVNGVPVPAANLTVFNEFGVNYDPRSGGPAFQDLEYRTTTYGFFVQDSWRITNNLTISPGIRWDFSSNPYEQHGRLSNIILGTPPPGIPGFAGEIATATIRPVPKLLSDHRIGYFAPRLSFAWDPTHTGKLSIRGGFGVFFDRWPNIIWSDATRFNPPWETGITASTSTPTQPQPVFQLCKLSVSPFNCYVPGGLVVGLNPAGGAINGLSGVGGVARDLKYAYVMNRFFGFQYAITPKLILEADYQGSQGVHLYSQWDRNRYDGAVVNGVFNPLNPNFFNMSYTDNSAWSHYNGATFSIRKIMGAGLTFQASYTFGKTISVLDDPGPGRNSSIAPVIDAYNLNAQRGLAAFDIPQKFSFNYLWEFPMPHTENRLWKALGGGWAISSLAVFETGYPATVITTAHDYNLDNNFYDVTNTPAYGNSKNCSRGQFLSGCLVASDFPTPSPGREGNLGRNTFRGPGYANIDFSAMKNFKIPWFLKEGARAQIRGEFFNVLNRVNLTGYDTNLADATFGQATGVFFPRTVQLAARIEF